MNTTRTYKPVDCGFVDHLDSAIMQRRTGKIHIAKDGKLLKIEDERFVDRVTEKGVEYALTSSGHKFRLDRIVKMFGIESPAFEHM